MKPISKLNRVESRRISHLIPCVLLVALSVGLLQRQLAALYGPRVAARPVTSEPSRREDAQLFSQALAAGLLRQGTDGRVRVAPADLPLRQIYARAHPELLVPRAGEPDWLDGPWDDKIRRLHQALHFSASGRYVRQQIEVFNARQWLAAIRWRSATGLTGDWRAERDGVGLPLTTIMPPQAERWFAATPGAWRPWQRVANWPGFGEPVAVRFRLALTRLAEKGDRLELLVVGGALTVTGAIVRAEEPRCSQTPPCAEADAVAHWLDLELAEGATGLELGFLPLPAAWFPDFRYDLAYIQWEGQRLVWRDAAVRLRELQGRE